MYTSSPPNHNQTARTPKSKRQFQIAALCVLLNKALQALKETQDNRKKTFFNTITFHRFKVSLFKLFPSQLNDQIDPESLLNTLLIHPLN